LKEKPSDIGDQCILFDKLGKCPFGFSCRYLNAHYKDGKIVINEELVSFFFLSFYFYFFQIYVKNIESFSIVRKIETRGFGKK